MIFKQIPTMISDLNKLGIALKSLDAIKIETVGVNVANVEAYRTALKGLSVEQSVFALASKGATEEQIRQILVTDKAMSADVEAAIAKAGLTTATKALTREELIGVVTKTGMAKKDAEQLLIDIGLISKESEETVVKKQLTMEILKQAVATGKLNSEKAKEIALSAGLTSQGAKLGNVTTGLFSTAKNLISSHPYITALAMVGIIGYGVYKYYKIQETEAKKAIVEAHETAQQALEDTKTSLSDDKSELQSVNSELETTKQKIQEISSIGTPTLVEQNELNKLSTTNAQLEIQKSLLENNIKLKQKSAALDAKELLGTQVEMEYSDILDGSSIVSHNESHSYKDHAKYQAFDLKNAYNFYMRALRDGNVRKQQLAQELIDSSAGNSAVLMSELLEIIESFKYEDGTIVEGYEDLYNEYMGLIYNLQSLTNPNIFLDIAKSVTSNTGIDYEKAISDAYKLAYEGNFDINKLDQDFVKALLDVGIDKDTIDYIFSIKQQEYQLLVDKINKKYTPFKSPDKREEYYWVASGEMRVRYIDVDEETKNQIAEENAINERLNKYSKEYPIEFQLVSSFDENFETLDKYIEAERIKAENNTDYVGDYITNAIKRIYDEAKSQSLILENKSTSISKEQIDKITEYQSKLKELYAALNLLRTNEMSPSDMDELISKFPELSEYIDNIDVLKEQIQALINENLILLKKQFDGVISEEALKKIAEYTVKSGNIDNSINSTVSAIDNITSAYQSLNKAIEEYNENGYVSLQTLEEIMKIKPEYLSAFIDENGKIKSNTDAYKELVKIQLKEYELSAREAYGLARERNAEAIKKAAEDYGKNIITLEEYERLIGKLGLDDYRMALKFIKSTEEQLEKNPDSIISPDSSSTSSFEQHIDWAAHSLDILQNRVSSLQEALSDVSGYTEQGDAIDNLIEAQEALCAGHEKTRDVYQKEYENILNNGILAENGLTEKVREKIEKNKDFSKENFSEEYFSIELFTETDKNSGDTALQYEAIQEAIEWYNKVIEETKNISKANAELEEFKMYKHDVQRKKWDAEISRLENHQNSINNAIDFDGGKGNGRAESYRDLIRDEIKIGTIVFERWSYEKELLDTLPLETDEYIAQEKIVQECADALAECDKNIKDWQLDITRLELEAIDDEIDSINEKIKANQEALDEKDRLISGAVGILNQEAEVQEGLRDIIQDRIDALQEENDEHERALALEKAKYELQRAYSQRTVKLYSGEERGFIYTQDRDAVRDAQENLDKLEYEETIHALQKQVDYYDAIIDNLNDIKDIWSNISSAAQEFLNIEYVIGTYGADIKDSILSNSYDTDGLAQSYQGLLKHGDELDRELKEQEKSKADIEETIERFENGTITYEQCLKELAALLDKVYALSDTVIEKSFKDMMAESAETLPTEVAKVDNAVKELEKDTQESTDNIKGELSDVSDEADKDSLETAETITKNLETELDSQRIILEHFYEYVDNIFFNMRISALDNFQKITEGVKDMIASAKEEIAGIIPEITNSGEQNNGEQSKSEHSPAFMGFGELPAVKDTASNPLANPSGEDLITVLGHQNSKPAFTPIQNDEWENMAGSILKLIPVFSSTYSPNYVPNVNNGTNTTPVVQNVTLTLPNVTNENGYSNLVNALKSLPFDSIQYTHRK